ncbi:MAG TPA: carboxypeptidase-like regulatory domain-containing protein [Kofleriaceae bacterium]
MGTHAIWCLLAVIALATPAVADDEISGFQTYATGEVTGRVTDAIGKPLGAVKVHAVSKHGEQIVTTDKAGRYRVVLRGGTTTIFVRGVVKITGQTAVSSDAVPGEELVEIRELVPPAVMPKALTDRAKIPEYSKAARDRNAWTKAWLMLEVGTTGAVKRVKLLRAPGFDLDKIAVREAFDLRFEPARDNSKKPVPAMMLWSFEWPSYFWMLDHKLPFNRLPREVGSVPCRGSGPARVHRDCTPSDISKEQALPWIDPPKR